MTTFHTQAHRKCCVSMNNIVVTKQIGDSVQNLDKLNCVYKFITIRMYIHISNCSL